MPVITHTVLPSVTGDGDDMFCLRCMTLPPPSGCFQSDGAAWRDRRPRATAIAVRFGDVEEDRSPQMIGVEPVHSGSGSFQAMFSVVLHVTGRFFSALTPSASDRATAASWPTARRSMR